MIINALFWRRFDCIAHSSVLYPDQRNSVNKVTLKMRVTDV